MKPLDEKLTGNLTVEESDCCPLIRLHIIESVSNTHYVPSDVKHQGHRTTYVVIVSNTIESAFNQSLRLTSFLHGGGQWNKLNNIRK